MLEMYYILIILGIIIPYSLYILKNHFFGADNLLEEIFEENPELEEVMKEFWEKMKKENNK